MANSDSHEQLRIAVREVCRRFSDDYWRTLDKEMKAERKFCETRLYQIAPISANLILSHIAEHTLGLPRSY
jgi:hypothetical protein